MRKMIFALAMVMLSGLAVYAQDIAGVWYGTIKVPGQELPLSFTIKAAGEQYSATISVPKQGLKDFGVKVATFSNDTLTLEIPQLTFVYKGVVGKDEMIKGKLTQLGQELPLDLGREKTYSDAKRPQEPKPPYPYISEDIKFRNEAADINLAGTITIPQGGGKYPAVVLVSGSGSQNRDEEVFDHKPFLVLSDYLTRNGIVVLRYDDRGFAESEGDRLTATTEDNAADAMAGVHYLRGRKEVNPDQIGVIGHSEGGIIAFMLAAKEKGVAYVVSMAGSAIRGDSILLLQKEDAGRKYGVTEEALAEARKINRSVNNAVLNSSTKEDAVEKLMEIYGTSEGTKMEIAQMSSDWMRFFIKYDPVTAIRKIRIPVLVLFGDKDYQVSAGPNAESFEKNVPRSNKAAEVKIYPDRNHLFQHSTTGMPGEYQEIEETINPEVLQDIVEWIKKVIK